MSNEIVKQEKVTDAELLMHLENLGMLQKLTVGEKNTFIQIAKAFNLNPFKREIHVSKYGDTMSVITGYEVYIKRAERTGQLDGWSVATAGNVPDGTLKATVTIHRKDRSHPFIWEADYSEYVQKTNTGSVTKFWQKANTMIKKVAISQGFRLCFSDELGGMPYTEDEMPTTTEDVQHVEVVATGQPAQKPEIIKKPKCLKVAFDKAIARIAAGEIFVYQKLKDTYELTEAQLKELEQYTVKAEELASGINGLSLAEKPQDIEDLKKQLPAYIVSDASFVTTGNERLSVIMAAAPKQVTQQDIADNNKAGQ